VKARAQQNSPSRTRAGSWAPPGGSTVRPAPSAALAHAAASAAAASAATVRGRLTGRPRRATEHPRVGAAAAHQFVVVAGLADRAALEHEDAVGVAHGRQSVRDDQRRAAAQRGGQRLLQPRLVALSMLAVASSSTSTSGSVTSARANASSCRCPG